MFAQEEARLLKHDYIGTEHLLLGVLRQEEGIGARVLESLDVTVEAVRARVVRIIGPGDEAGAGQIPFTPRGKRVLERSLREALSLGHNHIGTEHVLLALAEDRESVATRVLLELGVDTEEIRARVDELVGGDVRRRSAAGSRRWSRRRPTVSITGAFLLGAICFGLALGIGILIGWAIWG